MTDGSGQLEPVVKRTFGDCMEQLQEGYVAAVAATAGCTMQPFQGDLYGSDALLIRDSGVGLEEVSVLAQLKNTTTQRADIERGFLSYQFKKRDSFERLTEPRKFLKSILVVMTAPRRQIEWTSSSHDYLSLHHCCYWVCLEGQSASAGVSSPTVRVPTENVFDAPALTAILDRLERGDPL